MALTHEPTAEKQRQVLRIIQQANRDIKAVLESTLPRGDSRDRVTHVTEPAILKMTLSQRAFARLLGDVATPDPNTGATLYSTRIEIDGISISKTGAQDAGDRLS